MAAVANATYAPGTARLNRARAAVRRRNDTVAAGHRWAAVFALGSLLASVVGLAHIAYLAFAPLSILVGLVMLRARQTYAFITFTAWLWLLTPFCRRVIEWKAGYHASSLVLIPPAVLGLLAIPVALTYRRRVDRGIATAFVVAGAIFTYGAAIGVLKNGITGTAVDVLAIVGPLGCGLFALMAPDDPDRLRRLVVQFAVVATILLGLYGILQFFVVPAWDAQWMIDSKVITTGKPKPGLIRVFSTLNTATPFAEVLGALTLVALTDRRWLVRTMVIGAGVFSLGLSLVRTAWLGISYATLCLLNNGKIKARGLAALVAVGLVGLVLLGGPAAGALYHRLDKSVSSGSQDTSLQDRLNFQNSIAGETISNVVGRGMGSTGTALKLGATEITDSHFKSVDSGVFENATTYGSILGLVLLVSLVNANVAAWRRSRRGPPALAYCAAGLTLLMVGMLFTNTVKNAPGFVLWLLLAVCARIPEDVAGPQRGRRSAALVGTTGVAADDRPSR